MKKKKIFLFIGIITLIVVNSIFIISAFPNTSPIYCHEMGYQVKNNDCVLSDSKKCNLYDFFNSLCGKNYTKELSCASQGEYVLPGHECCEGLIEIKAENRISDGTCKDPESLGSWRVCSNCGNSVCDYGENNCNCKKDCNESEGFNNFTRLKNGCEIKGGNCISISNDCEEGYSDEILDKSYCFKSNEKCCISTSEEKNKTKCEDLGGYCGINECKGGYKISNLSFIEYCNGILSAVCCLKDNNLSCPKIIPVNCPEGSAAEYEEDYGHKGCQGPGKCFKNLSNGRKAEIKIMPETASEKAIARLGELGFTISLKEVGNNNESKPAYELTGQKEVKLLGFIKTKAKVSASVDAETGEVLSTEKPWWSFLASGF
jgi:hypothetical protein